MGRKWSKEQREAACKLDYERIIADYESGLTMPEVAKKDDCGERQVFRILKAAGKSRGRSSMARLIKTDGWRRLTNLGSPCRIVSIPGQTLVEAGLNTSQTIWGKWEVAGKKQLRLLLRQD